MANWYREDLAYIHDVGFSNYALQSIPGILEILQKNNIRNGLIVDLGCGSGLSAQEFIKAGYQVIGIDISQSMIELAKKRVPEAEFQVESLFKAEIPTCNAVISIGECLNYLFDSDNNNQTLVNLFQRIYNALIPRGIFIFDILEPEQDSLKKIQGFKEGKDWIVLFEKDEDGKQKTLTRRIITLRKIGENYRRDDEIHYVRLYQATELAEQLKKVGFQVEIMDNYGQFQLAKAHAVILARKPI
jgi:SAM-dependent methyltransferase